MDKRNAPFGKAKTFSRGVGLLSLLALSKLAVAQSGPPPTMGWVPQLRPGNPIPFQNDYIWTATNMHVTGLLATGGIDFDFDVAGMASYGDFDFYLYTNPGVDASAEVKNVGPLTYKWLWTPPLDPTTNKPDLINFPQPPNILVAVDEVLTGQVSPDVDNTDDTGLGGSSFLQDDWKKPLTVAYPGYALLSSINVLAGTTDATNKNLVSIALNPILKAKGTMDNTARNHGAITDEEITFAHEVTAITLNKPNPFTSPTALGDGTNQYGYDPNGLLYVEAEFGIPNFNVAEIKPLGPKLYWSVDIPTKSPNTFPNTTHLLTYLPHITDGLMEPRVTYAIDNNLGRTLDGFLVFQNLPASINDFGNHTVSLAVHDDNANGASKVSTTAHIQTFFAATHKTHPWVNAADANTPNWWWYFTQLYQAPGSFYFPKGQDGHQHSYNQGGAIGITDDAIAGYDLPVLAVVQGFPTVQWVGKLHVQGLAAYLQVMGHELGHSANSSGTVNTIIEGAPDADNDGARDAWESAHRFDPTKWDTTGAYLSLATIPSTDADYKKGDRECLADMYSLGVLISNFNLLPKDWSSAGPQVGKLKYPVGAFQLTFTPRDPNTRTFGTPTNVIPNGVLTSPSQL